MVSFYCHCGCGSEESQETRPIQYSNARLNPRLRYVLALFAMGLVLDISAIFIPAWIENSNDDSFGIMPYSQIKYQDKGLGMAGSSLMFFSIFTSSIVAMGSWITTRQIETFKTFMNLFKSVLVTGIAAELNGFLILLGFIFIQVAAPSYDDDQHKYRTGASAYLAEISAIFFIVGGCFLIVFAFKNKIALQKLSA